MPIFLVIQYLSTFLVKFADEIIYVFFIQNELLTNFCEHFASELHQYHHTATFSYTTTTKFGNILQTIFEDVVTNFFESVKPIIR